MLGVLRLDVDTCIKLYLELAPQIFLEEKFLSGCKFAKILKGAPGQTRFDSDILADKVKAIIPQGPTSLSRDAVLDGNHEDADSSKCYT